MLSRLKDIKQGWRYLAKLGILSKVKCIKQIEGYISDYM